MNDISGIEYLSSKEMIGVLASLITFCSYLLYFRGIIFFGTIPHAVSWFVWALFGGIAFFAQVIGNGGAGAWPTGLGALFCFVIAIVGICRGGREIRTLDIICLIVALVAIVIWKLCADPLIAVIIVSFADMIAMVPTARKAWIRPHQETLSTFVLTAVRHMLSLVALSQWSYLTALYPAVLILSNSTFVITVLIARKLKLPPRVERA